MDISFAEGSKRPVRPVQFGFWGSGIFPRTRLRRKVSSRICRPVRQLKSSSPEATASTFRHSRSFETSRLGRRKAAPGDVVQLSAAPGCVRPAGRVSGANEPRCADVRARHHLQNGRAVHAAGQIDRSSHRPRAIRARRIYADVSSRKSEPIAFPCGFDTGSGVGR